MAALDGALPFDQVHHVAVGVTEDLDLHVAGRLHVALQEHRVVAEGRSGLPAGTGHGLGQGRGAAHDAHAPAAAAVGCLDQHRPADTLGRVGDLGLVEVGDLH